MVDGLPDFHQDPGNGHDNEHGIQCHAKSVVRSVIFARAIGLTHAANLSRSRVENGALVDVADGAIGGTDAKDQGPNGGVGFLQGFAADKFQNARFQHPWGFVEKGRGLYEMFEQVRLHSGDLSVELGASHVMHTVG